MAAKKTAKKTAKKSGTDSKRGAASKGPHGARFSVDGEGRYTFDEVGALLRLLAPERDKVLALKPGERVDVGKVGKVWIKRLPQNEATAKKPARATAKPSKPAASKGASPKRPAAKPHEHGVKGPWRILVVKQRIGVDAGHGTFPTAAAASAHATKHIKKGKWTVAPV